MHAKISNIQKKSFTFFEYTIRLTCSSCWINNY